MATPFIGEVKMVSFNFPPKGWAFCNGQLLSIAQNQALFSILGTTYGGNGQTTFALPNLQGSVPMHFGNGFTQGQVGGSQNVTLNSNQAGHGHAVNATATATTNTAAGNFPAASASNIYGSAFRYHHECRHRQTGREAASRTPTSSRTWWSTS